MMHVKRYEQRAISQVLTKKPPWGSFAGQLQNIEESHLKRGEALKRSGGRRQLAPSLMWTCANPPLHRYWACFDLLGCSIDHPSLLWIFSVMLPQRHPTWNPINFHPALKDLALNDLNSFVGRKKTKDCHR